MITRLLTLALAATGLSVGGFQLGARQTSSPSAIEIDVPADLPADHALSVALQDPSTRVSMTDKEHLRYLAAEMESAKKTEGDARVRILREKIVDLERKIKIKQVNKDLYEVRSGDKVMRIRTPKAKSKESKPSPKVKADDHAIRFVTLSDGAVRDRLETAERRRVDLTVERRYEDLAIQSLPATARTRVQAEARGLRAEEGERGFALLIALRERTALNLTPPQVTKLQLLQADFLRRFAPMREESETGVIWNYPSPTKRGEDATITLGTVKLDRSQAKEERIQVVEGKPVTIDLVKSTRVHKTTPTETLHDQDAELVYIVEATPTKGSPTGVKVVSAQELKSKEGITFRVVLDRPGDVEKRIQALKAEIDDKVYEVLNDDQGKRLRRMVAISLSPQP